jgi:hypothetical protein
MRLRKLRAAAIDRGWNAQTVAVFRNRAPAISMSSSLAVDDRVVRQDAVGRFLIDHRLMRKRTASANARAARRGDRRGEEIFELEDAARRVMYLFNVTRETVDSCMPIASATVRRFSGRRCSTPCVRKASRNRTISEATRKCAGPLLETGQPVGVLQAARNELSAGLVATALTCAA